MSRIVSREEDLSDCRRAFGEQAGEEFYHLKNSFIETLHLWQAYRSLFGLRRERVALLNDGSGSIARIMDRAMFDSVVLSLCRLRDPAASGPRGRLANLTLERLGRSLEPPSADWPQLLSEVERCGERLVALRNKSLAHADLDVAIGAVPMSGVSRATVEAMIDAIKACLDHVHLTRLNISVDWTLPWVEEGAAGLLQRLYLGIAEHDRLHDTGRLVAEHKAGRPDSEPTFPDWLNPAGPPRA